LLYFLLLSSYSQLSWSQSSEQTQDHTDTVIHIALADTYCPICLEEDHEVLVKYPCNHTVCLSCNDDLLGHRKQDLVKNTAENNDVDDFSDAIFGSVAGGSLDAGVEGSPVLKCPLCCQNVKASSQLVHRGEGTYSEETTTDHVKLHSEWEEKKRMNYKKKALCLGVANLLLHAGAGLVGGHGAVEAVYGHRPVFGSCLTATTALAYFAGRAALKKLSHRAPSNP
ncbi:MAG: RING finger protein, partial [Zetaproteobacteria bacterium]|nr:RING finger protein [Zetaproteobacteria bacterium]